MVSQNIALHFKKEQYRKEDSALVFYTQIVLHISICNLFSEDRTEEQLCANPS